MVLVDALGWRDAIAPLRRACSSDTSGSSSALPTREPVATESGAAFSLPACLAGCLAAGLTAGLGGGLYVRVVRLSPSLAHGSLRCSDAAADEHKGGGVSRAVSGCAGPWDA